MSDLRDALKAMTELAARDCPISALVAPHCGACGAGRPRPVAVASPVADGIGCPEPVHGRIRRRPVLGGQVNQYESAA